MLTLFLIAAQVALCLSADMVLKRGVLWGGAALYAAAAVPTFYTIRTNDFGKVWIIWSCTGVIAALLIGRYVYGEPLGIRRLAALICAIAAIALSNGSGR